MKQHPDRPYITLKFASSLDGYLDDRSPERRVFSSAADILAVAKLRAEVDAILIGAGTLRRDNPRLTLRDDVLRKEREHRGVPAEPRRVLLTKSGNISPAAALFSEGSGERVIYAPSSAHASLRASRLPAEIRIHDSRDDLGLLLSDLKTCGVNSLLVEGGAQVLHEFLSHGYFDRVRLARAPELLGPTGDLRIPNVANIEKHLHLETLQNLDGMSVLDYRRKEGGE